MRAREARLIIKDHFRALSALGAPPCPGSRDVLVRSQDVLLRTGFDGRPLRAVPRRGRPIPREGFGSEHFLFLPLRAGDPASAPGARPISPPWDQAAPQAAPRLEPRALEAAFDTTPPAVLRTPGDCGQACLFCRDPASGGRRSRGERDSPHRRLATLAPGRRLLIEGEDPLGWEGIVGLVRAACARGFEDIAILTPGARLGDSSKAVELADAGLDRVEIPLYGATAARHDAVTRTPGSFARLQRGLGQLERAGVLVVVHTALVLPVLDDLAAIADLAADSGFSLERLEGLVADPGQEDRYARWAPDVARIRATLAHAAARLPAPLEMVDLPACATGLKWLNLRWTLRPGPWPYRHLPACEGCGARPACPGASVAYLRTHGSGALERVSSAGTSR